MAVDLSVVVPAFNERRRLSRTLPDLLALVDSGNTELIFVDDGSTDGTGDVLLRHLAGERGVTVLRRPHRGKGAAVRMGVAHARGDVVSYVDADLASDLRDLPSLVKALESADIAIGSRAARGAEVTVDTRARVTLGRGFNAFVRSLTGLQQLDTQCGFKAFRAPAAGLLFHLSRVDGWAFDVELLLLARHLGLDVVEVPIHWHEVSGSHVRPMRDGIRMSMDVLQCRARRSRNGRMATLHIDSPDNSPAAGTHATIRRNVRRCDHVLDVPTGIVTLLPFADSQGAQAVLTRLQKLERGLRIRAGIATVAVVRTKNGHNAVGLEVDAAITLAGG